MNRLLALYAVAAATSMAYELVWMKRMELLFGMSLPAAGVIMALFIAGVAAGAYCVARLRAERWPLGRVFGALQAATGVWALATPLLLRWIESMYVAAAPPENTPGHQLIRAALAGLVVFPPAAVMGAVFPTLSRAGVRKIYATGMLGSLAGVLAANTIVLPGFGMTGSLLFLGGVNLVVAALAWPLRMESTAAKEEHGEENAGRAIWIAAALGFALFMAEAVWFKLIWLVVDQTAYASGMALAAVMLAMSAGALAATRWTPPVRTLLALAGAAQVALVVCMVHVARGWAGMTRSDSFAWFLLSELMLALCVVGPAAFLYGWALPLLCKPFGERATAKLWAGHHGGAVLGMLVAVYLLIPGFGVTMTLAASCLVLAVTTAAQGGRATAAGIAALAVCAGAWGDVTYRRAAAGDSQDVVFHYEDGGGIVEVYRDKETGVCALMSSRLRQEGSNRPDAVLIESLQGELPLRLQPSHETVLVVGLGTGITLASMLDEDVRELTCVELSEGVARAAAWFEEESRSVTRDPRVKMILQDGRNFIRLDGTQYDLIVQELFFPYRSGVGALYTVEHFRRCRDRLRPGGAFGQWISLPQIDTPELMCLVRTFQEVFAEASLWLVDEHLLILGRTGEAAPDADVRALRYRIAGAETLRAWASDAPLNTEDNQRIEYLVPRAFDKLNSTALATGNLRVMLALMEMDSKGASGGSRAGTLYCEGKIAQHLNDVDGALSIMLDAQRSDSQHPLVNRWLARYFETVFALNPDSPQAAANFGLALYKDRQYHSAFAVFEGMLAADPANADVLFNAANCQARLGNSSEAEALYLETLRHAPNHHAARENLKAIREK